MAKPQKVLAALNEFKRRQIGTTRTHMYRLKSTEGEETLKTEVKLTQLKKNPSQKRQIVQIPISHSTRYFEKCHASNLLDFPLPLLLQCDRNHHSNLTSH